MFTVKRTLLKHDGGTKFYETVLIEYPGSPVTPECSMLIKRYGPVSKISGDGITIVERYSNVSLGREATQKILDEKKKHRAGKGVYIHLASVKSLDGVFDGNKLLDAVQAHYSDARNWDAVNNFFDLGSAPPNDIVEFEPTSSKEPAIADRGTNWGSF